MAIYELHRPESNVLYQSVARAWPKIEMDYAVTDQSISPHVTAEFERYKRCGILKHGFVRLYCKECDAERVIGFSCKGRGFCPACGWMSCNGNAYNLPGTCVHKGKYVKAF